MTKSDTYIACGEWEEYVRDLTQAEKGDILDALFAYWRRGELLTFKDRAQTTAWRPIQFFIDRCDKAYDAKCEQNRENGKKGGRPKKEDSEKPKKPNGYLGSSEKTEKTLPKPKPKHDPKPERGREYKPVVSPSADTTTTTALQEQIVQKWNQHDFVQKIKRVDNPQKRWERTEMAIAVAGGQDKFLNILDTLDKQAYLTKQPNEGYRVIYDWLIQPETFQSLIEGKYAKSRDKFGDGWEVVEFG